MRKFKQFLSQKDNFKTENFLLILPTENIIDYLCMNQGMFIKPAHEIHIKIKSDEQMRNLLDDADFMNWVSVSNYICVKIIS
mmetsp:Transcript_28753/g.32876  ORF Transcript_28753/g.32876 Transcript_28753/m.32876 type:complete len:82 (-) Transcript_28753:280-525(-)